MSEIITVRVPRRLKERMRRIKVNWSEEIRSFLERRVRELELIEVLDGVARSAEKRRVRVDSTFLIREDRDRK